MKIVAYGSLLNRQSLHSTILREPHMEVWLLKNWARVFNARGDKNSYLNIVPCEGYHIEVASFDVTNAELACLKAREGSGELVEVEEGHHAFVWKYPNLLSLPPPPPPLYSYIEVCTEGAHSLGIDFWRGTVFPTQIDDDRLKPRYSKIYSPWSKQGKRATRNLKIRKFLRLE